VFKPISAVSGGELSRVSLAKLILSDANVLLLDEPTNHLDIATREVLETALASFQGTLVMVSHDRTLVDKLCTRLILLGGGTARVFLGNYTDYRRSLDGPAPAKRDDDVMRIRETGKPQAAKQQDQRRERDARKAKKQLRELEDDIAALESLIETTEARFTELDPADYEAARELQREYDGYKADLQALYGDWEALAASAGE
jgi:ATP-binding cassette subfamily F protein 3